MNEMNHILDIKYWDKDVTVITPKTGQKKVVPLSFLLKIILEEILGKETPNKFAFKILPQLDQLVENMINEIPENLPSDKKEIEAMYKAALRMTYFLSTYREIVEALYKHKVEMTTTTMA